MKHLKYLFLLVFIATAISSCKKDDPIEPDPQEQEQEEEQEQENLAPFTIKINGVEDLNEGDVKEYTTTDDSSKMYLHIQNNTDETMRLRIEVVSATQPVDAQAEICFGGQCRPSIEGPDAQGRTTTYPLGTALMIEANKSTEDDPENQNANDIHYSDSRPENAAYTFEIFRVNEDLSKIETGLTFTYKYTYTP